MRFARHPPTSYQNLKTVLKEKMETQTRLFLMKFVYEQTEDLEIDYARVFGWTQSENKNSKKKFTGQLTITSQQSVYHIV